MLHWKNRLAVILVGVAAVLAAIGGFLPIGFHW